LLELGQLREQISEAVNGAMLAVGAGPDFLHGADQPGRSVGDDQAWGGEPTSDEIAAELEPVLLGLARARRTPTHRRRRRSLL
jgi:hypothetical protein